MSTCNENNSAQTEEPSAKKVKLNDEKNGVEEKGRDSFIGTKLVSVLNDKRNQKSVFIHGKFDNDLDNDAVIILEKQPFDTTPESLNKLLSTKTKLKTDLKNDIYSTFIATPDPEFSNFKATVIYPATAKHLAKYSKQNIVIVEESSLDYKNITEPFLKEQFENNVFKIQWVYNILNHKAESDRILFEDPNPETGFILLPDMKCNTKDPLSLYAIAIPHQHNLKSLRDLTKEHLPLLKNVQSKALKSIEDMFGVKKDKLLVYFHYQPSYYHLHIHINHIDLEMPGTGVLRAHLLQDVIENIELCENYYQNKTLSFTLPQNHELLERLTK